MTKINVYDETEAKLKNLAYNLNETIADIVEDALQEYIENNGLKREAREAPEEVNY